MKYLISPIFFALILTACGPKNLDEFMVDTSQFHLKPSALKDGEKVEILGASGNLTREHTIDFYNLVVVRSLETGDTVNVLVTSYFKPEKNDKIQTFLSNNTVMGKVIERQNDEGKPNNQNVHTMKAKRFKKVLYDTEFISVDVRKYPAVTGTLGHMYINGDLENLNLE